MPLVTGAKRGEEVRRDVHVEGKARRKLDQQASELVAERRGFRQERVEFRLGIGKHRLVRDRPGNLDRESERFRDACGPAGVRRRTVGPIERRIDLDRGKPRGVALQMGAFPRKVFVGAARQRPSCATDVDGRRCRIHTLNNVNGAKAPTSPAPRAGRKHSGSERYLATGLAARGRGMRCLSASSCQRRLSAV